VATCLRRWPRDCDQLLSYLGLGPPGYSPLTRTGQVKAYRLMDAAGTLTSEDVIRRVAGFRKNIDHYSLKMLDQANREEASHHTWQDELHATTKELLPAPVRELATSGKRVIVRTTSCTTSPLAALVTKPTTVKPRCRSNGAATFRSINRNRFAPCPRCTSGTVCGSKKTRPSASGAWGPSMFRDPAVAGSALELNNLRSGLWQQRGPTLPFEKATRSNATASWARGHGCFSSQSAFNDADSAPGQFPAVQTARGPASKADRRQILFRRRCGSSGVRRAQCLLYGRRSACRCRATPVRRLRRRSFQGGPRRVVAETGTS